MNEPSCADEEKKGKKLSKFPGTTHQLPVIAYRGSKVWMDGEKTQPDGCLRLAEYSLVGDLPMKCYHVRVRILYT